MFEGAYKYNQDNGEIPGTIKVGGLHQRLDARGGEIAITGNDPAVRNGDHGLYAILDQMNYRLPGESGPKGVSFGRIVGAPEDRNPVAFYWEGGFTFTGLMPGRLNNILGIAYARTEISNDLAAHVSDSGETTIISSSEAVVEMSYTAQVIPGSAMQPDFQYFWNPGGHVADADDPRKAIPNTGVLGLRTTLNY
jgi:porin